MSLKLFLTEKKKLDRKRYGLKGSSFSVKKEKQKNTEVIELKKPDGRGAEPHCLSRTSGLMVEFSEVSSAEPARILAERWHMDQTNKHDPDSLKRAVFHHPLI